MVRNSLVASLAALLLLAGSPAAAEPPPLASEDLLVAMRLGSVPLADLVTARRAATGEILLPLDQLAAMLALAIEVDPTHGLARGFVIDPSVGFELDAKLGVIVHAGRVLRADPGQLERRDDDIYVSVRLLEQCLPITVAHSQKEALITLRATRELPIQARWARERMAGRMRRGSERELVGPRLATPWARFDGPFIDTTVRVEASRARGLDIDHSMHVTAEVLGLESEMFLAGYGNELLSDHRWTLGRRDPEGGLLGRVNAREVRVGDVHDGGLPLITASHSGMGFRIGNFPLDAPDVADSETLRGALPSGWSVELHQDGALVDVRAAGADEMYEFDSVPLHHGANELRLEFHGPRGEVREEIVRRVVGEPVPRGDFYWRATSVDPDDASRQSTAFATYGLSERMSLSGGAVHASIGGQEHSYLTAGLQASMAGMLGRFDLAADVGGGAAAKAELFARLGRFDVVASHAEMSDFTSPYFGARSAPLRRRTALSLDVAFPIGRLRAMPMSLRVERDEHASGGIETELRFRIGASTGRTFVTNELSFRWADDGLGGDRAEGRLLARHRFDAVALRGELSYRLEDGFAVDIASLGAEALVRDDWFLKTEISHDVGAGQTRYAVGLEHLGNVLGIGGELSWDDDGPRIAVVVRSGLARNSGGGGWLARAKPLASLGAVSAHPFVDLDGNGRRGPGEPDFEATVRAGRSGGTPTDVSGAALLLVPAHRDVAIGIDAEALEDPLVMARPEAVHVVPRPGRTARVDLPIVFTADVSGTVVVEDGGASRPAGGAEVLITDASGDIVASAPCAHDGYYNVTRIPPGRYRIDVRWSRSRRELRLDSQPTLDVPASGLIMDGLDLVLRPVAELRADGAPPDAASSPEVFIADARDR